MATITAPASFTVGQTVTAANLDTLVSAIAFLTSGTPACMAYQTTTTTSIANNSWTNIPMDAALYDTDAGYASGRYTANTAGWYFVTGSVNFSGSTSNTNSRAIRFAVNGAATVTGMAAAIHSDIDSSLPLSRLVYLGKGDYLQVQAWQDTGATISTKINGTETSTFSLQFISA